MLEVFNTLLRHLRVSVDNKHSDQQRMNDEKNFQEAIINTIGLKKQLAPYPDYFCRIIILVTRTILFLCERMACLFPFYTSVGNS